MISTDQWHALQERRRSLWCRMLDFAWCRGDGETGRLAALSRACELGHIGPQEIHADDLRMLGTLAGSALVEIEARELLETLSVGN